MSLMTNKLSSIFLNLDTIYIMQILILILVLIYLIPEMDLFDKPDLKGKWKLDTNTSTRAMHIIFNFVQLQTHL